MDNLEEVLIDVLAKTYTRIIYSEERILKDMIGQSLSLKEFHTLEIIKNTMEEKTNTAGTIAKFLGITLGTLTTNLDRLEKKGLVHKVKTISDRRKVYVELTERGEQIHFKHKSMHKGLITKAISGLSMSEKVALMNAVNKLDI